MFEANGKDVARAKDREIAQEALKNGFTVNLRGLPYRYSPVLVSAVLISDSSAWALSMSRRSESYTPVAAWNRILAMQSMQTICLIFCKQFDKTYHFYEILRELCLGSLNVP